MKQYLVMRTVYVKAGLELNPTKSPTSSQGFLCSGCVNKTPAIQKE
jgi:hypothetical protein